MIGETFAHYRILEKLGEGGMGVVYKAEDKKLDRVVALKFLSPELMRNSEARKRFVNEAKAAAALNHPNICTIYEIDESEEQTFIAMEYIEGMSLQEYGGTIRESVRGIDTCTEIAIQIAKGLSKAHEKGIIHRDVKPGNILITRDGQAKIIDFGLAKLKGQTNVTKEGVTLGTVAYMSPEQARGGKIDHRTDIWSFGVIFSEMLTGDLPFNGEFEQAVIYSILNEEPEAIKNSQSDFPHELNTIVRKTLAKAPSERYQKMDEVLADLISIKKKMNSHLSNEQDTKLNKMPSIAVLPFVNMSPDPENEYFGDGLAEELINALTKLKGLRVAARTSAFSFRGRESDIREIGTQLNVNSILEGSVRKAGNMLRITTQLIDVESGYHLWSDRYDREMKDIFAIQDEITAAIVEQLKVKLVKQEGKLLVKRYTENIEAYRRYMEGRFWWNKRSQDGFAKANLLFKEAIEIDPDYALAYAGLAECYCMLSIHLAKPEPFVRQGRIAAEKALSIDETLAEAHAALGWIKFIYDWDWLGAERSFKKAIQLNPQYPTAYNWYAVLLSTINRHEEAIRCMTQAHDYDPGSAIINRDLGVIYTWAGDFERALSQLQATIEMDPDFSPAYFHMGIVYVWLKKYDLAIEYFIKVREMTGDFFDIIGTLGYTHAKLGQKEAALNELKKLEDLAENQDPRAFEFSLIHAGLGNNDKTLEWLDIACKNREFAILIRLGCGSEFWFEDLLDDPKFNQFLARIGLDR